MRVFDYDHGARDIGVRRYLWLAEYDYVLILQKKKKALVCDYGVPCGFKRGVERIWQDVTKKGSKRQRPPLGRSPSSFYLHW